MPKSYQESGKKNCPINNQVTNSLFVWNKFIDFLGSM